MADHKIAEPVIIKHLLEILPERPERLTTTEVCARLAARGEKRTQRTVQRQLEALEQSPHPVVRVGTGKPYQWALEQHTKREFLSQDPHTALALGFTYEKLEKLLPPETVVILREQQKAYDALLRAKKNDFAEWRNRVCFVPRAHGRIDAPVDDQVRTTVYRALLEGKSLKVQYRSRTATETREHRVRPLGIAVRDTTVTVIAQFSGKEEPGQLLLHRMAAAELSSERIPARRLDLRRYVEEGHLSFLLDREPLALELLVAPGAVESFREAPIAEDQRIEGAGDRFRLTATVPDTVDLRALIQSFMDAVEVVGPPHLRRYMVDLVDNAARMYRVKAGEPDPHGRKLQDKVRAAREAVAREAKK